MIQTLPDDILYHILIHYSCAYAPLLRHTCRDWQNIVIHYLQPATMMDSQLLSLHDTMEHHCCSANPTALDNDDDDTMDVDSEFEDEDDKVDIAVFNRFFQHMVPHTDTITNCYGWTVPPIRSIPGIAFDGHISVILWITSMSKFPQNILFRVLLGATAANRLSIIQHPCMELYGMPTCSKWLRCIEAPRRGMDKSDFAWVERIRNMDASVDHPPVIRSPSFIPYYEHSDPRFKVPEFQSSGADYFMRVAGVFGHSDLVQFYRSSYNATSINETMVLAAERGHGAVVQCCLEHLGAADISTVASIAFHRNDATMLRLCGKHATTVHKNLMMLIANRAAQQGKHNMVEIALEYCTQHGINNVMCVAARSGDLNTVRLCDQFGATNAHIALVTAIMYNQYEIFRYCLDVLGVQPSDMAITAAEEHQRHDMIEYLTQLRQQHV